jgi:hypothetical protein
LLKSFSRKEERFRTADFGVEGDTPRKRHKRREEEFDCAAAGQLVLLPDGLKPIETLSTGDAILSYDFSLGQRVIDEVTTVRSVEIDGYIRVNGALKITGSHRLWSPERGWTMAGDIRLDDTLLGADGNTVAVHSIERIDERATVFAVSVKTSACFFVGGYLAHNK